MAENRAQSLRSMGVTQLRKVAASRGIKGLSKADKETVYRALRSTAVSPMFKDARHANYVDQNMRMMRSQCLTPRQTRRMAHKANRAMGIAIVAHLEAFPA